MVNEETVQRRVQVRQSILLGSCVAVALVVLGARALGLPVVVAWAMLLGCAAVTGWGTFWLEGLAKAAHDDRVVAGVTRAASRRGPLYTFEVAPTGAPDEGRGVLRVTGWGKPVRDGAHVQVVGNAATGVVVVAHRAGIVLPLKRAKWSGTRALETNTVRDRPQ